MQEIQRKTKTHEGIRMDGHKQSRLTEEDYFQCSYALRKVQGPGVLLCRRFESRR